MTNNMVIPANYILVRNRGKGDESDKPIVTEATPGFVIKTPLPTGEVITSVFFQFKRGLGQMTHFIADADDLKELGISG